MPCRRKEISTVFTSSHAESACYCAACGTPAASPARFCSACGRPLMPTSPRPATHGTSIINTNIVTVPPSFFPASSAGPYRPSPGFLTRSLYFVFVGWWLGGLWLGGALALMTTLVGLPLGLWMINRLPQVMTLKIITSARISAPRQELSAAQYVLLAFLALAVAVVLIAALGS
jgi:hypothetical protein